jgi:hypothetical protein
MHLHRTNLIAKDTTFMTHAATISINNILLRFKHRKRKSAYDER